VCLCLSVCGCASVCLSLCVYVCLSICVVFYDRGSCMFFEFEFREEAA
jgi:hypothetical protein